MANEEPAKVPSIHPDSAILAYLLAVGVVIVAVVYGVHTAQTLEDVGQRFAADGVILAAAGLVIGIVTLGGVFNQIRIANEQLVLAREELKFVEADLSISRQMFDEATRKAKLSLEFLEYGDTMTYGYELHAAGIQAKEMNLLIRNDGKSVKDIMLHLYAPLQMLDIRGFTKSVRGDTIQGIDCNHYHLGDMRVFFEGSLTPFAAHAAFLVGSAYSLEIFYVMFCTDGRFPKSGFGVLHTIGYVS